MKKKNMKGIYYCRALVFAVMLISNNSYSQSNFQAGYIIDIHKDTIKGFVDYRNWDKSPMAIVFKTLPDSEKKVYTPADIESFSVAGESYIRAIVTVDDSPFRENELTVTQIPQYRTDTVFLQILINGAKSLFYLKDQNLKVHFFIYQKGVYETLVFIKYLQNVDGGGAVKTNEKFKGQLTLYFQDCPSIQKKINYAGYSKDDLISLFKEYYKCTQNTIVYQSPSEKVKSDFGIFAGLSLTNLKFTGTNDFNSIIYAGYPLSYNFTAGGFFNIVLPRTRERWSINNELMFSSFNVSGYYRDTPNPDIYTESYSSLGRYYITLNNFLRYKYPIKKMFVFLEGGISNGIAVSETNNMEEVSHIYSATYFIESAALKNARSIETGFILGLGATISHYSCELRIERGNGMSTFMYLASPVIRCSLIIGYKF